MYPSTCTLTRLPVYGVIIMKHILVITLLLFSNPVAAQQRSDDSMLCASLYLIVSSIVEEPGAIDMISKLQESFETIYSSRQTHNTTNGEIGKLKHEHAIYLGNLYDRDPDYVVAIEMKCDAWRQTLVPHWQSLSVKMRGLPDNETSRKKVREIITNFPRMPGKNYNRTHSRWDESEYMVILSFETWNKNGRRTPYSIKQEIYKDLGMSNN